MALKVGICFGGYCPMHQGHLDAIMRAKKENDICYVVVCGYNNEPRATQLGIPLDKRFQLVKEFFKNDEIVRVLKINDTELGIDESMSISNWEIWIDAVLEQMREIKENKLEYDLTFYVAEESYEIDINILKEFDFFNWMKVPINKTRMHCQSCNVVLMPKEIEISGTLVRENPLKYWNQIVKPFRKFLTKNILVIGTASEGKTTLVRDIAKYFDIPHIEEYGRTYMEERNMLDTDLTCHDFTEFLFHQRQKLLEAEESNANNKGIIISDTDNLITLMYAKAYSSDNNINFTKEEFRSLKSLVQKHLMKGVYWNKIFLIPPGNKFVDDGSRYMKQSSLDERWKNYHNLLELMAEICPEYVDKITELKPGDYYGNFLIVKKYINSLLSY